MGIKQEVVVYNDKSQRTTKRLQINYYNVADGAYYGEPEEQNADLTEEQCIIDADDFDDVPDIEMMVWEQDIPWRQLDTSMDKELSVILNNKSGWLSTLLTSVEEQLLETSQWYVAQHGRFTVRLSSMLTLHDKQWLNDEIINFYNLVILAD